MLETKFPTSKTKTETCYEIPITMEVENFYELIYEFVDLAKKKGLTVRQAQYLFESCKDYVLDSYVNICSYN